MGARGHNDTRSTSHPATSIAPRHCWRPHTSPAPQAIKLPVLGLTLRTETYLCLHGTKFPGIHRRHDTY